MLLLVALPWSTQAIAYRPFDSTDADIARKGEVEVEMGPMGYLAEGSERFLVVPRLILNWGFVANWEAVVLTRSHQPGYFAGAILEGPAAWRFRPVGEAFLEDARDRSRIHSALVGAIGRLREGLSVDATVRAARGGGESIHEARAGLTWDFPAPRAP